MSKTLLVPIKLTEEQIKFLNKPINKDYQYDNPYKIAVQLAKKGILVERDCFELTKLGKYIIKNFKIFENEH